MTCFEENTFTLAETVYPRSFLHVKEKVDMLAEPSYWSRTPGNVFMGMCHTFQYPEPTMQVTWSHYRAANEPLRRVPVPREGSY